MKRKPGLHIGTLSHLGAGRFAILLAAFVINLLSLALALPGPITGTVPGR